MAFHHRVKPHHHASIWAIAALSFAVSSLTYTNALMTYAATSSSSGPSQKTKDFFGAGGDDDKGRPQVCIDEENARLAEAKQGSEGDEGERASLSGEMTELQGEIAALESQVIAMGQENPESEGLRGQLSEKQARLSTVQQQLGTMGDSSSGGESDRGGEPSETCRKAMVDQFRTEKKAFKATIQTKIVPTFTKVKEATSRIASKLDALEAAGADPAVLTQIRSYLSDITTYSTTLITYMEREKERIDAFPSESAGIAAGESKMNSWDDASSASAAKAADSLVSTFEKLLAAVETL